MREKQSSKGGDKEPVITIRDLDFSYEGIPGLAGVNLTVEAHDSVCIVGPNGGGKTTLIKLILGLLQPDRGEIRLFGGNPRVTRLQVGYVPQYARYDPLFPVTVLDVVLMGRLGGNRSGRYARSDREAALSALEEMRLIDTADRSFATLSGGQQQRVLIARALASATRMLILDEPTANIDAKTEVDLFELLQELNTRMTILMATHDLGFVSQFFKSVVCVNHQVVVHPTSLITGEVIQEIYGGDFRMVRHDHRCAEGGHEHG